MTEFQIPHLEWEHIDFPLTIHNLVFEKTNWDFGKDASITIWRDNRHRLKAEIKGVLRKVDEINKDSFIGEGNIITGQKISGRDSNFNLVELHDCFIGNTSHTGINSQGLALDTKATIVLYSIRIVYKRVEKNIETTTTKFEWFICKTNSVRFNKSTKRYLKKDVKLRVREGVDPEDDYFSHLQGSSSSRDFCKVELEEVSFLLGKVPENFVNNNVNGLFFEFRENAESIDEDLTFGIQKFVGFLLGNELISIGHSLVKGDILLESFAISIAEYPENNTMPPIKFNSQYEWGNFSYLVNTYLPKYLEIRNELFLDVAIEKSFIANNLPLGTNLPILASALETIITKYFKSKQIKLFEYISEKEYLNIIEDELETMSQKLQSIDGNEIILRKIKGAFRKGVNEKTRLFFSAINLEIGGEEQKAISLRNKMAHGSSDYSANSKVYKDLVASRVYEVLFNRVILTLLGYEGYYIDYSITGVPSKHISKPAGTS